MSFWRGVNCGAAPELSDWHFTGFGGVQSTDPLAEDGAPASTIVHFPKGPRNHGSNED